MAERIPERSEIPARDRWDLTPLFPGTAEWEDLYTKIERDIERYDGYAGRLAESPALFREALEFDLDTGRALERIYTYAHLKSDEDTADQAAMGLLQRAMNLYRRASERSSFMTPEIQALPEPVVESYLADPAMAAYRFYLDKILRWRPHTLSAEIEEILAMGGEVSAAPNQIFSQLDNADMKFGFVTDGEGREVELSHGNMISLLMDPSREVRKNTFHRYYESYVNHRHTLATTLASSIKKDWFHARVRSFASCRSAALFGDNVPEAVYDALIASVRKNLAPLFRYLDFRKKSLGLDELHFYDTYVPLVQDVKFDMPYEEAVETCVAAIAPLGDEYTSQMKKGLLSGWVDRYENRGKRSGAYSSGCYDSPPYILTNYRADTINSLYTLIHEAGHSMHTLHSIRERPYVDHEYTIFVAEVASTFNETLLSAHLLERYRGDAAMTRYILNREIDDIRGTLYRQTMFAEFEKRAHDLAERNEALTLETLRGLYRSLLDDYFGGAIVIDPELELEFTRIPHFYSAFYVYKYATGISAAIALAKGVLAGNPGARDRYLSFLGLGGSMFPLDELRAAGVDMADEGPVASALGHFSDLVDRFMQE